METISPQQLQLAVDDAAAKSSASAQDIDMADASEKPSFGPLSGAQLKSGKIEMRRIPIPPHRMTPLQKNWIKIYTPLTENLQLQVRMNLKSKCVEVRTCEDTQDAGALQKAADFVKAFALGFEIADALALLRMDDLYLETFEVKDVKTLHGDHMSRAIGRIVGKDGKTKYTIENSSRTRVVVADSKVHILGTFQNIKVARDAIVRLILGSTPGKVYSQLRIVSARQKERF
ncbi:hypothetical protein BJ742DRAFT_833558 [Cladochytrium replicatum]|nr:hypothetical protein BJ742DRAFT_833558 [Cladochytrium replicatum]